MSEVTKEQWRQNLRPPWRIQRHPIAGIYDVMILDADGDPIADDGLFSAGFASWLVNYVNMEDDTYELSLLREQTPGLIADRLRCKVEAERLGGMVKRLLYACEQNEDSDNTGWRECGQISTAAIRRIIGGGDG